MIVTTWDGHLRVDRSPDGASVTLTLLTVEPTSTSSLRADLVAGFVAGDPDGPPARLVVTTPQGRLPDDVAALLGSRVAGAVTTLVEADGVGAWVQLDLAEIHDLAAAWAPYRARVLQDDPTAATVGSWAGGVWTALELPDWRDLVVGPAPVFRGGPTDSAADPTAMAAGRWLLPERLADAAACGRTVSWTLRRGPEGALRLEVAVAAPDAAVRLLVGIDEPGGGWEPLQARGGTSRAMLDVSDEGPVAVRFRTGTLA